MKAKKILVTLMVMAMSVSCIACSDKDTSKGIAKSMLGIEADSSSDEGKTSDETSEKDENNKESSSMEEEVFEDSSEVNDESDNALRSSGKLVDIDNWNPVDVKDVNTLLTFAPTGKFDENIVDILIEVQELNLTYNELVNYIGIDPRTYEYGADDDVKESGDEDFSAIHVEKDGETEILKIRDKSISIMSYDEDEDGNEIVLPEKEIERTNYIALRSKEFNDIPQHNKSAKLIGYKYSEIDGECNYEYLGSIEIQYTFDSQEEAEKIFAAIEERMKTKEGYRYEKLPYNQYSSITREGEDINYYIISAYDPETNMVYAKCVCGDTIVG